MVINFSIVPFTKNDFAQVRDIYQQGIDSGIATFQTVSKNWQEWDSGCHSHSRLVAKSDEQVLGWATLSPVSQRACYAGVAEVTIYIAGKAQGLGVGKALLNALVEASEQQGIWTLQSGIFSVNQPSIRLHEACGFRVVGVRERIAQRDGKWFDNVLMERRSNKVGID